MQALAVDLQAMGKRARTAAHRLATLSAEAKNEALASIAAGLESRQDEILAANESDCDRAGRDGMSAASLDRLVLDPARLEGIAGDVMSVAALPDPVGEVLESRELPNGLRVSRRRVPLGVIGAIYESRPNVTVDIAALCFKSGNAVILKGGSEALASNSVLASVVRDGIEASGAPVDAVQFVDSTDRSLVGEMLAMKEYIDLVVPRGGAELVRRVAAEAAMPAITGGIGVCHAYVDRDADLDMAVSIVHNAKVQRPYVCNAVDTVLVHSMAAPGFLPRIAGAWSDDGVEMRCDRRALSILGQADECNTRLVAEDDWGTEFLALTAAIKIVDSMDEALDHIERYTSGHTEAIVTEDRASADRFVDEVDAGVVLVNASTRFNDGSQLGLGAEVGISTDKLHARGPIGLTELTSYKWTVFGSGQVRT